MFFGTLGQYAIGQGPAGSTTYSLTAEAGAIAITAQTALSRRARVLQASPDVGSSSAFVMYAPLGAVALGQNDLTSAVTLSILQTSVGLFRLRVIKADGGLVALTFSDVSYRRTRRVRKIRSSGGPKIKSRIGSLS